METFVYKKLSIDFDSRLIVRNGAQLTLDPKAFNTLAFLIEQRNRVVSNDELIKEVWDDRPINNDVVTASIGRVRKMFKDAGVGSEVIRTVHKVGYQFVLQEREYDSPNGDAPAGHRSLKLLMGLNLVVLAGLLTAGAMLAKRFYQPHNAPSQQQASLPSGPNEGAHSGQTKSAQRSTKPTELFFIRHAEKESDGTDDPPLSKLGIARAKRWRKFFEDVDFDLIYTTRFIRNTQTVDHVFGKDSKNLHYYSALSFDIAVELDNFASKKVAIIGHSNTIPGMVNRLVTDRQYGAMDHRNYELIYQVTVDSSGGVSANQLRLDYLLDQ